MPDIEKPTVKANQFGLITDVNTAFETLFQWKKSEIIGKPLTTIIPEKLHDAHNMGFSRFLNTKKPTLLDTPLALIAVKKNGEEFKAEHFISAQQKEAAWEFTATITPTTPD